MIPEPTFYPYPDGKKKRVDLTIVTPVSTFAIDVSIPDPTGEHYLSMGAASLLGVAANDKAKCKYAKHSAAVKAFGHKFYAFVIEAYGHTHPDVDKLISQLALFVPPLLRKNFAASVLDAVHVALQTGNAEMLAAATKNEVC